MKKKYAWLRRLPVLLGIAFSLLVILAVYLLKDKFQKPPQTKKLVQQITMIQPPPPPPPPPEQLPPEEQLKEDKVDELQPEEEPEPAPEQANEPATDVLGLDADGNAGADGFGLSANKGGKSILGGGGGSLILWYGGQVKRQLEDGMQNQLAETVAMETGYSVVLDVSVDAAGQVNRIEMTSGSGKADVDAAIRAALPKLKISISRPPPENMPQPIKIRLTSRV